MVYHMKNPIQLHSLRNIINEWDLKERLFLILSDNVITIAKVTDMNGWGHAGRILHILH